MGRNTRMLVLLALVGLSVAGCRTYNVQTDWDPEVAFDALQRFQWVEPPSVEGANPFADNTLLRKRVRLAIEGVLSERGFLAVDDVGTADFLVTYSVILDERFRVDGVSTGIGNYHRRSYGFGHVYTTTDVRAYQESTLIIDLLDPSSQGLLWRGWGTGIVRTRDRGRGRERMEDGVRAILEEFPPGAEERADPDA